ncbi:hypothetical protein SporoP37_15660 [Sporosarcina sp. P37]|uniref:hypothetical protein n=1 Tax=unclassified Sporosarcina TaxID=2647733 RepID=UPI000A17E256|nr:MULTISPECIES: hypothetical protein [unclassified Sporosarcina]ARK25965.1 hypothetical protein SporoP37_15660 [Sporosarcina sp. P37]PID19332.1 hypothetical protein CSV62_02180 [Sporosarcina sp. P35]
MLNIKETVQTYSFEWQFTDGKKIDMQHLLPSHDSLISGDTLKISVSIDGMDPSSFVIKVREDLDIVIQQNEYIDSDSSTIITIEIIKNTTSSINIYNLDIFVKYLESLTLQQLFQVLKDYSVSKEKVLIHFQEFGDVKFSSNLFSTIPSIKDISDSIKKERVENINLVSNTSGITGINLIPEDLKVYESSAELKKLESYFSRISTLLCIAFISDWSEFDNNQLNFKILGYQKIDCSLSSETSIDDDSMFFKIYQWIFESGNGSIEDKLGLSRNIISRYIRYNKTSLFLDKDAYTSIITSYKIYLKENVEKYIETKNKVAELMTEISLKNKDVLNFINSSFKNNNLTILGYFISIFIFNSLSNNDGPVFNLERYYLSLIFLLISTIYFLITAKQLKKDLIENARYFFSIKRIYKDLFSPQDLNRIFDNRQFKYNIKNVKSNANRYLVFWLIEIVLLLFLTIAMTFYIP